MLLQYMKQLIFYPQIKKYWEETPRHYLRLDVRALLQEDSITEVRHMVPEHYQMNSSKSCGTFRQIEWLTGISLYDIICKQFKYS